MDPYKSIQDLHCSYTILDFVKQEGASECGFGHRGGESNDLRGQTTIVNRTTVHLLTQVPALGLKVDALTNCSHCTRVL